MTRRTIPRLIAGLAVPTIISMMVTAIYNTADTFFVSQLGTSATGAVGIVFSIMAIIQAVGFMLGQGGASIVSRLLGQKDYEKANRIGSTTFFLALLFGLAIAAFGLAFTDPFMRLLGATPTILPFARSYASYILLGAPIMVAAFVLNNLLRSQGLASRAMIGLCTGGIVNILLDPICIFNLHLGIAGAAIATLISQCISFTILLVIFLSGQSIVKISLRRVSHSRQEIRAILATGFPSLCRQGLASIATVMLNVSASAYGDPAVAAVSIVGRLLMFVLSAMIGFGQGYQPVAGTNYGARQYARVRKAFHFSLCTGFVLLTSLAVIGFVCAPNLIQLFRADDPAVVQIGTNALRAQCLTIPLHPMLILSNMTFQVFGRAKEATFLASTRQGIFFLPLIFLLPRLFGLTGVVITQAVADLFAFACCVPFVMHLFHKMPAHNRPLPTDTPI